VRYVFDQYSLDTDSENCAEAQTISSRSSPKSLIYWRF
jgi:hypothetical protein